MVDMVGINRMVTWFSCFADVPGLDYRSPLGPKRLALPGHDARPRVCASADGSVPQYALLWPSDAGETSTSPVLRWRSPPRPGESDVQAALRQLVEALDLPGALNDYHFRLQDCCNSLWRARIEEPELLAELERLFLLDLQLIERYSYQMAAAMLWGATQHVATCHQLISLYEHEGLLREALSIAERGQRLNPETMMRAVEHLRARVALLEAEERDAMEETPRGDNGHLQPHAAGQSRAGEVGDAC